MTDERSDDNQAHFDAAPSPKHHKKDTKRYVAFHSDEQDSSEVEEETPRYVRTASLELSRPIFMGPFWALS